MLEIMIKVKSIFYEEKEVIDIMIQFYQTNKNTD